MQRILPSTYLNVMHTLQCKIQSENQHMHLDFTDYVTTQPLLVALFGYIQIIPPMLMLELTMLKDPPRN